MQHAESVAVAKSWVCAVLQRERERREVAVKGSGAEFIVHMW